MPGDWQVRFGGGVGKPARSNPGRAPRPYPTATRSGAVLARHAGIDRETGQLAEARMAGRGGW